MQKGNQATGKKWKGGKKYKGKHQQIHFRKQQLQKLQKQGFVMINKPKVFGGSNQLNFNKHPPKLQLKDQKKGYQNHQTKPTNNFPHKNYKNIPKPSHTYLQTRSPEDIYLDNIFQINPRYKGKNKENISKYIKKIIVKNCWYRGYGKRPKILLVGAQQLSQMINYQLNTSLISLQNQNQCFTVQRLLYMDQDFQQNVKGKDQDQIFQFKLRHDKLYQSLQLENCIDKIMDHYYSSNESQENISHHRTNYSIFDNEISTIVIQYNLGQNQNFIKIKFDHTFKKICAKFVKNSQFDVKKQPYKRNKQILKRFGFQRQLKDVGIGFLKVTQKDQFKKIYRNNQSDIIQFKKRDLQFFESYNTQTRKQKLGYQQNLTKQAHIQNLCDQSISIEVRLTNKISLRIYFQFSLIENIYVYYNKNKVKQNNQQTIYLTLKNSPKYYAQITGPQMHFNPYHTDYWHIIPNFPTLYNKYLPQGQLRALFNNNCSIKLVGNCRQTFQGTYFLKYNSDRLLKANQYFDGWTQIKNNLNLQIQDYQMKIKQMQIHLNYALAIENKQNIKVCQYINQNILKKKQKIKQQEDKQISQIKTQQTNKIKQNENVLQNISYQIFQNNQIELNPQKLQLINDIHDYLHVNQNYLHSQCKKSYVKTKKNTIKPHVAKIVKVYNVHISPSGIRFHNYTYHYQSRIFRKFDHRLFIKATFCEDDGKPLSIQNYYRDSNFLVRNVFRKIIQGFMIEKYKFIPFGWSNSQIKHNQMWFILHDQYIYPNLKAEIMKFLGQFDPITNPAKKAARIGQCFCASIGLEAIKDKIVQIQDHVFQDFSVSKIQNQITRTYCFSDGIGLAENVLFLLIMKQMNLKDVCAIQCRYKGYKGVLIPGNIKKIRKYLNLEDQSTESLKLYFPKSMKKYQCSNEQAKLFFDVLNWNKYSPGFMNNQILVLLNSLKVPEENIMKKIEQHLSEIYKINLKKPQFLLNYFKTHLDFSPINEDPLFQLLNYLSRQHSEILQNQNHFIQILLKVKRQLSVKFKAKMRFRVEKSAKLIGILDTYQILNQGEVYCAIKKQVNSQKIVINQKKSFITKNPCLHPADIRKVKCIDIQQIKKRLIQKGYEQSDFDCYVNCIVFPQKGQYPLSCQISGGDLDGDYYLLCWDEDLYPPSQANVHLFDDGIVKQNKNKVISQSQIWDFFINHLCQQKLGLIAKHHLNYADYLGADSEICLQLADLHSKALDFSKKGDPYKLDPKLISKRLKPFYIKKGEQKKQTFLGRISYLATEMYWPHSDLKQRYNHKIFGNQWFLRTHKFQYSRQQIQSAMNIVLHFKQNIQKILQNINKQWSSQYIIYSGRDDELVIDSLQLKISFQEIFFSDLPNQDEITYHSFKFSQMYKQDKLITANFSEKAYKKAYLWYIISHSHLFKYGPTYLQYNIDKIVQQFIGKMQQINHKKLFKFKNFQNYDQDKYYQNIIGLTWHVIPKIIVLLIQKSMKQQYQIPTISRKQDIYFINHSIKRIDRPIIQNKNQFYNRVNNCQSANYKPIQQKLSDQQKAQKESYVNNRKEIIYNFPLPNLLPLHMEKTNMKFPNTLPWNKNINSASNFLPPFIMANYLNSQNKKYFPPRKNIPYRQESQQQEMQWIPVKKAQINQQMKLKNILKDKQKFFKMQQITAKKIIYPYVKFTVQTMNIPNQQISIYSQKIMKFNVSEIFSFLQNPHRLQEMLKQKTK